MWNARASLAGLLLTFGAFACAERSAPIAPAAAGALKFIENDAPRALADAKTRHVPVFVEAWAPW